MSDRNAKLSIETDASSMGKAAEDAKKLATQIEKVGDAGGEAAGDLNKAAASLEKVEAAEKDVVDASGTAIGALEAVGTAALESSQTAAEGATRAAGAVEDASAGVREWPGIWGAAGEAASQAAAEAKGGVEALAGAEEQATAGTRKLEDATEQAADAAEGFKEGVQQIEKLAEAIDRSELSLQDKRTAITAAIAEVDKLVAAENAAGRAGQETANLATKASDIFRGKLAQVTADIEREAAELRKLGPAGSEAFDAIGQSAFNVDATTSAAAKHIAGAWEQLNDNFSVTPRQLSLISQAVTATEIAIVHAGERGQAISMEQLALYERQKASLAELTAIANKLTNASKDNAVGLKQTGAQLAGVTSGVQQLTSMLGPNASKIGMVVGNVGQLGSVMESLDAGVKSLDINTLSLTGSTAKYGAQLGAVAITIAAATAAGAKLAATNSQNAEVMDSLADSAKKLGKDALADTKDQVSGLQGAFQSIVVTGGDVLRVLDEYGAESKQSDAATKELNAALDEMTISFRVGASGVKLYNIARRDGLDAEKAYAIAVADSADVLKFYEDSARGGAEGHRLWLRALVESEGDAEKMAKFIGANNDQMQRSIEVTSRQTEEQKQNNAAQREGIDIARIKGDEGNRLLTAEEQNLERVSRARRLLEQAVDGHTAAIDRELSAVRAMIGDSARNSEALRDVSGAISELAKNTDGLSEKERARLELIAEMTARGEELTTSEREYVAALALAIINGDKKNITMKAGADIAGLLKTAIDDLVTATQAEASAHDANETAIQKAVKAAEKLLASNTPLDVIERQRLSTIVELGKQVGELAAQQDRLTQAAAMTAEAENASGAAESSLILIKSGKVDVIQREIDARVEMIKALASEKTSTEDLTKATQAIVKIQEDGRTVYTNVTEAQRQSAAAMKDLGVGAEVAGDKSKVLILELDNGKKVISNLGFTLGDTSEKMEGVGATAATAGPKVRDAFIRIGDVGSSRVDLQACKLEYSIVSPK